MKTVKIADLKTHMSAYLRVVRAGGELIVSDRETPFARISPLPRNPDDLKIRKATRPMSDLKKIRGVTLDKPIDPLDALLEDRSRG